MRRLVASVTLSLLAVGLTNLNAQITAKAAPAFGAWEQVPMPPKTSPDAARDLYFGPSGDLYVSFDKEGIWRTGDFGKVWQNIQYDMPGPIAGGQFCFNKEGELLYSAGAGAARGIYRLPVGQTKWEASKIDWTGMTGADGIGRMTLNKTGDVIAISAGCQVLRSTDGGRTFKHIGNQLKGAALFDLKVSPLDANELAIGNETGPAWRSTDGGLTWTDIGKAGGNARLAYNRLGQLFSSSTHDAASKGWLFARWVEGTTWVQSDKGLPAYEDTRCSVLTPSGLMFVGNTSAYVSRDDGKTWQLAGARFPSAGGRRVHVRCLALGGDGLLYAASSSPDKADLGLWRLQVGKSGAPPAPPVASRPGA